jgi:hypothetical protein
VSEQHPLPDLESFASVMRQTNLPGTDQSRFLRKVYGLAARCHFLQTKAQQNAKQAADEHRPTIDALDAALVVLEQAQKYLNETRKSLEKNSPRFLNWRATFDSAKEPLLEASSKLRRQRQLELGFLHRHFLKYSGDERTTGRYKSLLYWDEEYPLDRWGSTPAETWLIGQLDDTFSGYFTGKKAITQERRYKLILAVLDAAFGGSPDTPANLDNIKVRLSNIRKRVGVNAQTESKAPTAANVPPRRATTTKRSATTNRSLKSK